MGRLHTWGFAVMLLTLVGVSAGSVKAQSQTPNDASAPVAGPTLGSWTDTALDLRTPQPQFRGHILPRQEAVQREMEAEFGAPVGKQSKGYPFGFDRWEDTAIHRLVKWGTSTYGQIRESTQFRTRGFNLGVDADHITSGRIGVRLDRPLD